MFDPIYIFHEKIITQDVLIIIKGINEIVIIIVMIPEQNY